MKNLNFKLTDKPIIEDNPEFLAIPEFARLTDRQMRYVMLVDWYGSPLRLMKFEDRKVRAALMSGYKYEKDGRTLDMNARNLINGKTTSVEAARKVMRDIQYDHEMDLKESIDSQLDEMTKFFRQKDKTPTELEKAVKLMTALPSILDARRKILETLNFREVEVVNTVMEKDSSIEKSILDEYNETY